MSRESVTLCIERLSASKKYFKADFKVHVQEESRCADHCKLYALSDGKEFSSACPHNHESSCERCDNCKDVLRDLPNILDDQSIFDRFVYNENNTILQNFSNHIIHAIKSMQKHILMSVIDNEVVKDKCQNPF